MPVIASCPGCGGSLSETSVLALAPVCNYCRAVIINVGGTLGLTGVYGVNDQSLTQRRVEADLSVLQETLVKYNGMKEACKEQLNWGVERYAELPQPPELLELQDVPPLWDGQLVKDSLGCGVFMCIPGIVVAAIISFYTGKAMADFAIALFILFLLATTAFIVSSIVFSPHFRALAANGERPRENARRQEIYEKTRVAALKAAEPIKAAQDHRLRVQISELEGLENTVRKIEEEVRQQLKTFR